MDKLQDWLKSHSITSKSVSATWVMLVLVYSNNPEFHEYVRNAYAALPHGLHSFVAGIVIPIAIFWRSTHTTTVTATVEDGSGQTANATATTTGAKIPDSGK